MAGFKQMKSFRFLLPEDNGQPERPSKTRRRYNSDVLEGVLELHTAEPLEFICDIHFEGEYNSSTRSKEHLD